MLETSDCVIYISDKYNLDNNSFEKGLVNNLTKENILELAVFLDYKSLNKSFKKTFKEKFSYNLDNYDYPILITYVDGSIANIQTIDKNNSDISEIIDFGALK